MEPLAQLNQYNTIGLPANASEKEALSLFILSGGNQATLLATMHGAYGLLKLRARLVTSRDKNYKEAIQLFNTSLGVRCCDRIVCDMTPLSVERIADLRQWLLHEPHVEHPLSGLIRGLAKYVVQEGYVTPLDGATTGTYFWSFTEGEETKLVVKPEREERGCEDNPHGWDSAEGAVIHPSHGGRRAVVVQRLCKRLSRALMPCTVRAMLPFRDGLNGPHTSHPCLVYTFVSGATVDEVMASDQIPSFPDAYRKRMQAIAITDIILGSYARYGGDVVVREMENAPVAIGNGTCLSTDHDLWRNAWISWGQPNKPLHGELRTIIEEMTDDDIDDLCAGANISPIAVTFAKCRFRLLKRMMAFDRGGFRLTLGDVGRVLSTVIIRDGDSKCRFARMMDQALTTNDLLGAFNKAVDSFLTNEVNGALNDPDAWVVYGAKQTDPVLHEICVRVPTESDN